MFPILVGAKATCDLIDDKSAGRDLATSNVISHEFSRTSHVASTKSLWTVKPSLQRIESQRLGKLPFKELFSFIFLLLYCLWRLNNKLYSIFFRLWIGLLSWESFITFLKKIRFLFIWNLIFWDWLTTEFYRFKAGAAHVKNIVFCSYT